MEARELRLGLGVPCTVLSGSQLALCVLGSNVLLAQGFLLIGPDSCEQGWQLRSCPGLPPHLIFPPPANPEVCTLPFTAHPGLRCPWPMVMPSHQVTCWPCMTFSLPGLRVCEGARVSVLCIHQPIDRSWPLGGNAPAPGPSAHSAGGKVRARD